MDMVDFINKTPTMTHPNYSTIIKLWCDKRLYEKEALF